MSCGFVERYDPATMAGDRNLTEQIAAVLDRSLEWYDGPRDEVLDVGCGTLFYRSLLEERFGRVLAIDSAREMLGAGRRAAAEDGRSAFLLGEAERLPFGDGAVDCVLGFDLLHHLQTPRLFIAEAARVLRPGGVYLGIEPNMLNPGMWLAHLIPAEERGALRVNWPHRLARLFRDRFARPRLAYYNLSISSGLAALARRLHPFRAEGSSLLAMRIVITARKSR